MSQVETQSPPVESTSQDAPIPFAPDELKQFGADDAEAGRNIGKMLSLFFVYTVLVMTVSLIVTVWWIRSGW